MSTQRAWLPMITDCLDAIIVCWQGAWFYGNTVVGGRAQSDLLIPRVHELGAWLLSARLTGVLTGEALTGKHAAPNSARVAPKGVAAIRNPTTNSTASAPAAVAATGATPTAALAAAGVQSPQQQPMAPAGGERPPRGHLPRSRVIWWSGIASHFPTADGLYDVALSKASSSSVAMLPASAPATSLACAPTPRNATPALLLNVSRVLASYGVDLLDTWRWTSTEHRWHPGLQCADRSCRKRKLDCTHVCIFSGVHEALLDAVARYAAEV